MRVLNQLEQVAFSFLLRGFAFAALGGSTREVGRGCSCLVNGCRSHRYALFRLQFHLVPLQALQPLLGDWVLFKPLVVRHAGVGILTQLHRLVKILQVKHLARICI